MRRIWVSITIISALFFFNSCKEKAETTILTKEVSFIKEGELKLIKAENDSILAQLDIEIADDAYQTETGLMYRKSMPVNQGMLFIFKDELVRSFYMKNTEFPLDIIYINSQKEIESIQENAQPFNQKSLPSNGPVQYVLEVNAGLSKQWSLKKGDRVEWTRTDLK